VKQKARLDLNTRTSERQPRSFSRKEKGEQTRVVGVEKGKKKEEKQLKTKPPISDFLSFQYGDR
jgi:hypothetical protein